jgi:hypothetical protein
VFVRQATQGSVVKIINNTRTQSGHIRKNTRDASRRIRTAGNVLISRRNCVADDRGCPRVTLRNMVRRGSTVRVRQRASSDLQQLFGLCRPAERSQGSAEGTLREHGAHAPRGSCLRLAVARRPRVRRSHDHRSRAPWWASDLPGARPRSPSGPQRRGARRTNGAGHMGGSGRARPHSRRERRFAGASCASLLRSRRRRRTSGRSAHRRPASHT